jgi:riboflavin transporter FmnP
MNMPKDKKLIYVSILNLIVGSLTSLDFEQLFAADEFFKTDKSPDST